MSEPTAPVMVWMVTSGDYDGFGVDGVFSNEADAQVLAEKIRASEPNIDVDVESWELNQRSADFLVYRASYAQNLGSARDVKPTFRKLDPILPTDQRVWESIAFQKPGSQQVQGVGYGRTQEEAEANLWAAIDAFKAQGAQS